eukprot:maker-scaffold1032_size68796-snap-gene-0.13 protein:Tk08172 transcript:maker-scaffold1032_size68796-snap-gene-0.13-mRNA-1 annotation:"cell adhesion molecule 3 precursor"
MSEHRELPELGKPGDRTLGAVRLLEDSIIPPHAFRGQKAVLRCNYDLEGDDLYSIKWYFNQKEFYRYIPSDNPPVTIFKHHSGVNVNPKLSSMKEVVLDEIDFLTSGQYRCEISGDAPMFQTASAEGLLFVVDLPDSGPDIFGGRPRYTVGDEVNVTCASRNSLPAAKLSWYVNGEKADSKSIIPHRFETSFDGLQTSKLGLAFKVDRKHFLEGDLKLKCTATISTVYWKSNEESVQGLGGNQFPPLPHGNDNNEGLRNSVHGLKDMILQLVLFKWNFLYQL